MIKIINILIGLFLTMNVNATVLNFEDININSTYATLASIDQSEYAEFTWEHNWAVGTTGNNNYANAAHSGTQYLSNFRADKSLTISSNTLFDFEGVWLATPLFRNVTEWISISAFDQYDQLIGTTGQVSLSQKYSWVASTFDNVSYLTFTSNAYWYVLDDFTYRDVSTSVPAPTPLTFIAFGLITITMLKRKKSRF